ncbi:MAG: nuclear transport factor 2 family protein [Maritimibacter sp.]
MSADVTLDEILACERAVWDALMRGDAEADEAALDPEFLGVYATGFSDRADHVSQIAAGPSVARYEIDQPRLMRLSKGVALIAYRARYLRVGSEAWEAMYVSSIWQRGPYGWRNIFSQDTEESDHAPV